MAEDGEGSWCPGVRGKGPFHLCGSQDRNNLDGVEWRLGGPLSEGVARGLSGERGVYGFN